MTHRTEQRPLVAAWFLLWGWGVPSSFPAHDEELSLQRWVLLRTYRWSNASARVAGVHARACESDLHKTLAYLCPGARRTRARPRALLCLQSADPAPHALRDLLLLPTGPKILLRFCFGTRTSGTQHKEIQKLSCAAPEPGTHARDSGAEGPGSAWRWAPGGQRTRLPRRRWEGGGPRGRSKPSEGGERLCHTSTSSNKVLLFPPRIFVEDEDDEDFCRSSSEETSPERLRRSSCTLIGVFLRFRSKVQKSNIKKRCCAKCKYFRLVIKIHKINESSEFFLKVSIVLRKDSIVCKREDFLSVIPSSSVVSQNQITVLSFCHFCCQTSTFLLLFSSAAS